MNHIARTLPGICNSEDGTAIGSMQVKAFGMAYISPGVFLYFFPFPVSTAGRENHQQEGNRQKQV